MRIVLRLLLFLFLYAKHTSNAESIERQSFTGIGGKLSWSVNLPRLSSQKDWDPALAEPPLAIREAVNTAREYVVARTKAIECKLIGVNLKKVPDPRFERVWYYYIQFLISTRRDQRPGEYTTVLVLMDGTTVEPVK